MWLLAVLTREVAALTGFSYEKMYSHFDGQKISGRINNEVAV